MSILTRTVSYTDSTGTTLQSHFAYPAQGEKAAAVLVAPEWWGLSEHAKNSAERLAEQGYAALATDLYGNALLTEDPAVAGENMMKLVNNPDLLAERTQLAIDASGTSRKRRRAFGGHRFLLRRPRGIGSCPQWCAIESGGEFPRQSDPFQTGGNRRD